MLAVSMGGQHTAAFTIAWTAVVVAVVFDPTMTVEWLL
jgi:hypothetical protein